LIDAVQNKPALLQIIRQLKGDSAQNGVACKFRRSRALDTNSWFHWPSQLLRLNPKGISWSYSPRRGNLPASWINQTQLQTPSVTFFGCRGPCWQT